MPNLNDFAAIPPHRPVGLDVDTARNMLKYRALSLRQYSAGLTRTNPSAPDTFIDAVDMVELYAASVAKWADLCASEEAINGRLLMLIRAKLKEFATRERFVDHVFARSGQIDVPLSLREIVRRELETIERMQVVSSAPGDFGIDDTEAQIANALTEERFTDWVTGQPRVQDRRHHRPITAVLAVGPPNRFDFRTPDLEEELFGDQASMWRDNADHPLLERRSPKRHVVVLVPHLEGTRSLWQPIVVGHELGHVRLEAMTKRVYIINLLRKLRTSVRNERQPLLKLEGFESLFRHRTLSRWLTEILCDLNSVRMYGPAGLAAIAEMLYVVDEEGWRGTGTMHHPPLSLRVKAMISLLSALGFEDVWESIVEPIIGPFRPLADANGVEEASEDELRTLIEKVNQDARDPESAPTKATREATLQILLLMLPALVEHATATPVLGPLYDVSARRERIVQVAASLSKFLPAEPMGYPEIDGDGGMLVHADIVNGAWLAYLESVHNGGLPGSDLGNLPYDKLATFSSESLEFVKLWQEANSRLGDKSVPVDPSTTNQSIIEAATEPGSGGILSGGALVARLVASGTADDPAGKPLVVSPLMEGGVRECGLDVRLGTRFITFRRSGTALVDPLGDPRTWRTMEEFVQEPWGGRFILHPGELVLAATMEFLVFPDDLAAQVVTRSSYGRLGQITATAVQVQPGTNSCVTLELVNMGRVPIALIPGHRIAQLVFTLIDRPVSQSSHDFHSKYSHATGPVSSQISADRDLAVLREMRKHFRSSD